ncbi:MAG: hypothetical protein R3D02_13435 [Hyphomicrobiales bacterium]
MKRMLVAGGVVVGLAGVLGQAGTGHAETCEERFARLVVDGYGEAGPVKILAVQEMKGAKPTRNWNYQLAPDHWMSEMIEPENLPWSMVHKSAMFASYDKGKSWQKIRDIDSAAETEAARKGRLADIESARNAACGEETFEGVAYETVEGDYTATSTGGYENHHKYWIVPATGWIERAVYRMAGNGFEITTTQTIEKAPDLKLPTP